MKFNTIIFFIDYPFGRRDYVRYGVETLLKNGFSVKIWDFAPFTNPRVYDQVKITDHTHFSEIYVFRSEHEALKAISSLTGECLLIFLIGYKASSLRIFRKVSQKKLSYCVFSANYLPFSFKRENLFRRLGHKHISWNNVMNFLVRRVPYKMLGLMPATFVLAGGEKSVSFEYPVHASSKIIWLHTLDYDIYLQERGIMASPTNTAVFLDEYLPFHPDYIHYAVEPYSTAEEYFPALCRFFDFIEKKYSISVIIAAHPRSRYDEHPDYFGGRPVIRGNTAKLVASSQFVMNHSSTAINFAVLFRKPTLFLTTDRLIHSPQGSHIETMASWLGGRVINVDKPTWNSEVEEQLIVREEAYNAYTNAYIKKAGSPDGPFWKAFADAVRLME